MPPPSPQESTPPDIIGESIPVGVGPLNGFSYTSVGSEFSILYKGLYLTCIVTSENTIKLSRNLDDESGEFDAFDGTVSDNNFTITGIRSESSTAPVSEIAAAIHQLLPTGTFTQLQVESNFDDNASEFFYVPYAIIATV